MAPGYRMSSERVDRPADDGPIDVLNHELRTALMVLMCHTELLQELDEKLPVEAYGSLEAIARGCERLQRVEATISQLVDLERAASECACGGVPSQDARKSAG